MREYSVGNMLGVHMSLMRSRVGETVIFRCSGEDRDKRRKEYLRVTTQAARTFGKGNYKIKAEGADVCVTRIGG